MFVTAPALRPLLRRDSVLAALDRRHPGVRPVLTLDVFGALVRAISAQQVNLTWATETRRRLALAYGRKHRVGGHEVWSLDRERLAAATVAELRALQFTTAKAVALLGVAGAAVDGRLDRDQLAALPDGDVIARLTAERGIGPWSADWVLARTFGRPRVVASDLGVRKAVGAAYLEGRLPTEHEVRQATAHWGDAACIAQELLLHGYAAEATRARRPIRTGRSVEPGR
jgi:DNA-3-methyladenine glycosylase II